MGTIGLFQGVGPRDYSCSITPQRLQRALGHALGCDCANNTALHTSFEAAPETLEDNSCVATHAQACHISPGRVHHARKGPIGHGTSAVVPLPPVLRGRWVDVNLRHSSSHKVVTYTDTQQCDGHHAAATLLLRTEGGGPGLPRQQLQRVRVGRLLYVALRITNLEDLGRVRQRVDCRGTTWC